MAAPAREPKRLLGKPCLYLSNMPYCVGSDRISAIMQDDNLAFLNVEAVLKGPRTHLKTAGLATVHFETESDRDQALEKLNMRMLDGRAILASCDGFVEADEHGKTSATSNDANWLEGS